MFKPLYQFLYNSGLARLDSSLACVGMCFRVCADHGVPVWSRHSLYLHHDRLRPVSGYL